MSNLANFIVTEVRQEIGAKLVFLIVLLMTFLGKYLFVSFLLFVLFF